ncbi:MAG: hypothetical protein IME94_10260, partial [Proteobacteria bacterium]|nr:hypothetical protein [Pseudomonadota bacterium]
GKYQQTAIRNIDWALSKQNKHGWFSDNCLDNPKQPLVHTIAYNIQGILEAGIVLKNEAYISKATIAAIAMADQLRPDGSLSGRYDSRWNAMSSWSCLTGNAQMSIIWSRLHHMGINSDLYHASEKINNFSRSIQNLRTNSSGRNGGVKGTYPVYGGYGTFEYLNWAVKFFMDAFLLEEKTKGNKCINKLEKNGIPLFWGS